jgi:hypothetical protein
VRNEVPDSLVKSCNALIRKAKCLGHVPAHLP